MRKTLLLLGLVLATPCFGVMDSVEAFRMGLLAYQANGPDALLRAWFTPEEQDKIVGLRKRFISITDGLGDVVDTEVFAPKEIGRHVQRVYGVIYFQKRPLWLRAEYYTIEGKGGFISLEFSKESSDILPLEIGVSGR
ncbi:MAG: hypothetical protein QM790_13700 [Nibricoccus sp.]